MKILEICPFSAGICGVWSRVKQESLEFSKLGHEVTVFSSNIEKGTNKIVAPIEEFEEIKIKRFKGNQGMLDRFFLSKNVVYFAIELERSMKEFIHKRKLDLVITHLLHPMSFIALKICNENNIPCYMVTHAPFNVKRNFFLSRLTNFQRSIQVKPLINKFQKVITITKWENPYLLELGVSQNKIEYIPNGIPEEFFTQKATKEKDKVLFLGRIAPVKDLEVLIEAAQKLPDIEFSIVGLAESEYLKKLSQLKSKNVKIYSPIYDLKKKIKLIDEHRIFILPSKREAMPQSLIESMSRGKIAISSKTDGGKEIIKDAENGFLFDIGDSEQLVKLIQENIKGNKKIQDNAKKSAKKYSWKNLIKKYQIIFEK